MWPPSGIWARADVNRSVLTIGRRLRGVLIALNVDSGGRARVHAPSHLDLSLFYLVPLRIPRPVMGWYLMRRHLASRRICVSLLVIRNPWGNRQKIAAPHRLIVRRPSVLATTRSPLLFNDRVRRQVRRDRRGMKPVGPNAERCRKPARMSRLLRPLTLTVRGVIHDGDGLLPMECSRSVIRPASFAIIFPILALCGVCLLARIWIICVRPSNQRGRLRWMCMCFAQ